MLFPRYTSGMKSKIMVAICFITFNVAFAEEPTPGVLHFDHAKVAALFEKGGPLLATNNFKIQAGRRTGPGEVEIHVGGRRLRKGYRRPSMLIPQTANRNNSFTFPSG